MGLDAVVYRNRENLGLGLNQSWLRYDEETGETSLADDAPCEHLPPEVFCAAEVRLGNISAIAAVREAIKLSTPDAEFLLTRVVYSGIHGGDQIEVSELPALCAELDRVERAIIDENRLDLAPFIADMRELAEAAEQEQNPIVFC